MKIFILSILLLATVVFAADYGGADKYPIQTRTGGSYILSVSGVDISPTYDLQARADAAAVMLSLKCGCEVSVRQPVLKYSTEWRKVSSSSSSVKSSSSSTAISASSSYSSSRVSTSGYIEWQAPTQREDGSALESVAVYHVIFEENKILVSGDKTKLNVDKPTGVALIAAQDSGGLLSSYAQATVKAVF